jgi:alanine racemase
MHRPLRLTCSQDALRSNYRTLQEVAGTQCGAAVKADGYGLGARPVVKQLLAEGCRDFFVSSWWEAEQLAGQVDAAMLAVLHGLGPDDLSAARAGLGRPVLNSVAQVARWKEAFPSVPCDVMIDTGMSRLGLRAEQIEVLSGLSIHTLHSHLACGDEESPMNALQLARFRDVAAAVPAARYSLANSAGILLGKDYGFDLVRPGLAIYGGVPRAEGRDLLRPVAQLQAQVVQRRTILAGESCGYNATFVADADTEAAIINIGYADGYWRGFSGCGRAHFEDAELPVIGRVSMDLVALDCDARPDLAEGQWVTLDFELERSAELSGMSQYELLTGLGRRFERVWH